MIPKQILVAGCGALLLSACAPSVAPTPKTTTGSTPPGATAKNSSTPTDDQNQASADTGGHSANSADKNATQSPPNDTGNDAPERDPGERVAVGHKAPEFQLQDQNGKEHSLKDLLANGKVALVFYRSADW